MLTPEHFSCVDVYGAFSKHLNMGRRKARTNSGEHKTICPFCGGRDRFNVWPDRHLVEDCTVHAWCRGCDWKGDVVKFIQEVEGLSFLDACDALNVPLDDIPAGNFRRVYRQDEDRAPSDAWQAQALKFADACIKALWSDEGSKARAYLRWRGLDDETIRRAGLGYQSDPKRRDNKADWGLEDDGEQIWIPCGIVIPWQAEGQLWAINIRRSNKDIERDKARGVKHPAKYVQAKGGNSGMYDIDALLANVNKPVLMVEGEFDALLAGQLAGDLCTPLATGGTKRGRLKRWVHWIAQAPVVLIAFDADEDGQGEQAAKDYWLAHIPHARLWLPLAHDLTDMHHAGLDIREWLRLGIRRALRPAQPTKAPAVQIPHGAEFSKLGNTSAAPQGPCALCGAEEPRYYWHEQAGHYCCADCDDLYTWAHDEVARLRKIERHKAWT